MYPFFNVDLALGTILSSSLDEVGGKLIDIAEKMTSLRHELVPLVDVSEINIYMYVYSNVF